MFKTKSNLSPPFMKKVFPESDICINLRYKPLFKTSNVRSVHYGTEMVHFRGPQIWSLIPDNFKTSTHYQNLNQKYGNGSP